MTTLHELPPSTTISEGTGEALLPPAVSNLQRVSEVLTRYSNKLFVASSSSYYSPHSGYVPPAEPLNQIERKIYNNQPIGVRATFYVALRNGKFDPHGLEKIRKNIAKSLAPLALDQTPEETMSDQINYGYIVCDDKLATVSKNTTSTATEIEPGALKTLGLKAGETNHSDSNTIWRRIFVKFVPHPVLAIILRNEVPKYSYSDKRFAENLARGISKAQLQRFKEELVQNKYASPQHILFELVKMAQAEEYRRQEAEIQRFFRISGR